MPQMSVARNLFLGREPRGRLGLIDFAAHAPGGPRAARPLRRPRRRPPRRSGELGLGVQQMVAIARAVSTDRRRGRDHGRADVLARTPRGRPARRGDRDAARRRRRRPLRHPQARRGLPPRPAGHRAARRPPRAHRPGRRTPTASGWSRRCSAAASTRSASTAAPASARRTTARAGEPVLRADRADPPARAGRGRRRGARRRGGRPGRPARVRAAARPPARVFGVDPLDAGSDQRGRRDRPALVARRRHRRRGRAGLRGPQGRGDRRPACRCATTSCSPPSPG